MLGEFSVLFWAVAFAIAVFAGIVKGITGFAMPMILVSGLGTITTPEVAIAGLILPTLVTNIWQSLRGGLGAALNAMREHWVYLGIVLVIIAFSAQLVLVLPEPALFLILGAPVTLFAGLQLLGWRPHIARHRRRFVEIVVACFAGFVGGLSGVWGPPTVIYLTALDTPKAVQVQIQGIAYGAGSIVLLLAHLRSGVFNADSASFSAILLVPAVLGLMIGFRIQDNLDQERFRKITLGVLVVAGLNLIRRGLIG